MKNSPCRNCKCKWNARVCRKFCAVYKRAALRDTERQLDETLFLRLARISR